LRENEREIRGGRAMEKGKGKLIREIMGKGAG